MTIFVEARASEIQIPNAKRVADLESRTGADLMISRLAMPCTTEPLLRKHLSEGALLIQYKDGEDLAASATTDRLVDSLARMREYAPRMSQRWLLFVGILGCDSEGSALINGKRSHQNVSFVTVDGAITAWIARGGSFYSLAQKRAFASWCGLMERRLEKWNEQPYRFALSSPSFPDDLPAEGDALQLPIRVQDARRVLIGFKGLGVETVNKVWAHCGDFKSSLHFLTDPASAGVVEGIGPKTIASIRKQCGLSESDGPMLYETSPYIETDVTLLELRERQALADETKPTEAQLDKDMSDLFGKSAKRRKTKETV